MARFEKLVERFASESEDLVEHFVFGVDVRQQRRRGEINARDTSVRPTDSPARTAAIRDGEIFLVAFRFTNKVGFEGSKPFAIGCEGDGAIRLRLPVSSIHFRS
jgi:hypothetical protein